MDCKGAEVLEYKLGKLNFKELLATIATLVGAA
jgi:hypothetical protein